MRFSQKKKHMDFFCISLPLSFSPVTTDVGELAPAPAPDAPPHARVGHGSGSGGGSVICPFIEKKL